MQSELSGLRSDTSSLVLFLFPPMKMGGNFVFVGFIFSTQIQVEACRGAEK